MKSRIIFPAEASLSTSASFSAIRDKVSNALMMNVRAGVDMDCDGDGMDDTNDYAWVQDIYPSSVIYSMNGCLYQCDYKIDKNDKVTFGTPQEVETVYKPVGESMRVWALQATSLKEAAYDAATGKLTIKVIEAGFNKGKGRYYPAETLKRDYKIFEGAKMFADHQTDAEARVRPEGSVHNWVANVQKVWAESSGTIRAEACVIDPPFKAKLATLAEKNLLGEMGISIRAVGEAREREVEGVKTNYVESLLRARSVDFVTYAGAGGQVEAMESSTANEFDLDIVTEAQLRERRPDLVTLVESSASEKNMKTLEQQLQEATTALETERTEHGKTKTKLTEAETATKKQAAATELTKLLTESKLPAAAQDKLKKQFENATEVKGIKEAIDDEVAYIKSVGGTGTAATGTTTKKNLGAKDNSSHEEKDKSGEKPNLVEAFSLLMPNKKEAELAASR
jgi:hypothetical protein